MLTKLAFFCLPEDVKTCHQKNVIKHLLLHLNSGTFQVFKLSYDQLPLADLQIVTYHEDEILLSKQEPFFSSLFILCKVTKVF